MKWLISKVISKLELQCRLFGHTESTIHFQNEVWRFCLNCTWWEREPDEHESDCNAD